MRNLGPKGAPFGPYEGQKPRNLAVLEMRGFLSSPLTKHDHHLEQVSKYRIKGFDGIRAICAICVIVHHTIIKTNHIGEVSVYIFFALSGFLIMGIIKDSRRHIESGHSNLRGQLTTFLANRAIRILPVYYITIFAVFTYTYIMRKPTFLDMTDHIAWYLTYTQNFFIAFVSKRWGSFTHSWSLAVEQQFYIIFPALFLFSPLKLYKKLYAFLIISMFAIYCLLFYSGFDRIATSVLPFLGFSYLLTGGMMRAHAAYWLNASWIQRHREALIWALSTVIICLSVMPGSSGTEWSEYMRMPAPLISAVLAIVSSLLLFMIYRYQESSIVMILDVYPLRMLGKISYALYVFHYPIINISYNWVRESNCIPMDPTMASFIVTTVLSISLALLSYQFVERPIAKLKGDLRISP